MQEIKLDVQTRNIVGTRKIKGIRREGFIPAVVYGGTKKASSIQVDRREYEKIMRHHKGESVIFHLNILENGKQVIDCSAVVREQQHEPVSFSIKHIDFQKISLTEVIEVKVSVVIKGDAIGVKAEGGSLDQHIWELDILCLPLKIPAKLEVDVSHLKIGDAVHVKEVKLPEGVKTKHDPESVVCAVVPPMKEKLETEGEVRTEPEVLKEKKDKPEAAAAEGKDAKAAKPEAKAEGK
jgi:large subunit ribosomal protein L25